MITLLSDPDNRGSLPQLRGYVKYRKDPIRAEVVIYSLEDLKMGVEEYDSIKARLIQGELLRLQLEAYQAGIDTIWQHFKEDPYTVIFESEQVNRDEVAFWLATRINRPFTIFYNNDYIHQPHQLSIKKPTPYGVARFADKDDAFLFKMTFK